MKPILKWAGGKSKLLTELTARIPADVGTYAEPFAGGAALFFALADHPEKRFARAILADQNEDLIACYRAVRDDVGGVIRALEGFAYEKETFYRVRDEDPARMTDVARAARVLYLNKTCFNGLWRVNSKGKFNVPFGRYTNPRIVDEEGLTAASRALAKAELVCGDFAEAVKGLGPGDFAYFDPPYVPLTKTASFTAYAKQGFGAEDQARLARVLVELRERGVLAMLSNADTEGTRELYEGFALAVVQAPRAINSDAKKRGGVSELIVTSWGPCS